MPLDNRFGGSLRSLLLFSIALLTVLYLFRSDIIVEVFRFLGNNLRTS